MTRPLVAISGSVHMDLIAAAPRLPQPGETMPGHRFSMHAGGKGGNQAISAARLGAHACMIARLGDDPFGRDLRATLEAAGVDGHAIVTDREHATGASTVLVGEGGDYASIIVPGAAALLSPSDLDAAADVLGAARITMLQLELPLAITIEVARRARAAGGEVMLNAAPAPEDPAGLPQALLDHVTVLLVNAVELGMLACAPVASLAEAQAAVRTLAARTGVPTIVATLGARGVVALSGGAEHRLAAHAVDVVDTVGAGDAFAGALAVELARGSDLAAALRIANAAGALAVTRAGAAASLPDRVEVDAFLAQLGG